MTLSLFARNALVWGALALAPVAVVGQTNTYVTNGVEYAIAGLMAGDQVHPQLGLNSTGGYLVWEDNFTDGDGLGVSALQLDAGYSGVLSPFRVNGIGAGDQERPQVSMLKAGGAAFVWQGGPQGFQRIYARFISPDGTWMGNELRVNAVTNGSQANATVATLTGGNVVVAWNSYNQFSASSYQDVYAQILGPTGQKVGGEFLVNQFTAYNQRTPAVAALSGGGFVVVWVSEQARRTDVSGPPSVDIFGRVYNASGTALGAEFLVNTGTNICANPSVAAASDGTFMVAWGERSPVGNNSWDIYSRPFSGTGEGGTCRLVNTVTFGDQLAPHLTAAGTDYLAVWTSLGQDGSREGVYGQFLRADGTPSGGEFRVNTKVLNSQIHPTVASDGASRFLAAWSSYGGTSTSFDLSAQRYDSWLPPLQQMNAPLVYVPFVISNRVYQPQVMVMFESQAGLSIDHYEVYVDGKGLAGAILTSNVWVMTGTSATTYSFQVCCVTTDGRRSPLSPIATATTWSGMSYYGIPVEWMNEYWYDAWPPPNVPLAPGGLTPLQVFLTGGDPLDPRTWLKSRIVRAPAGYYLEYNSQPGHVYQVQSTGTLKGWSDLGSPRFAAGVRDQVYLGGTNAGYYRILCLH